MSESKTTYFIFFGWLGKGGRGTQAPIAKSAPAKSFIYSQDYMWHWQNYMWYWQIHLLTFTIELILDMTLAWDPTFIKYPMN